ALQVDLNEGRSRGNGALDQRFRQRVFNIPLQGPAQRPRAVTAIDQRFIQNPLLGFFVHGDGDVTLGQVAVELLYQQFQDLDQVVVNQRVEDDHFIQAV